VFDRIVAGVDESPQSRDAATLATAIAEACRADLLLVSAYQDPLLPFPAGLVSDSHRARDARAALAAVRPSCATFAHTEVVADISSVRGLRRAIRRDAADLLVLGSRCTGASGGGVCIGHTARRMLRDAPCAVAVAGHPIADTGFALRRIVVAVDQGDPPAAALRPAAALARAAGATLELVGVVDDSVPMDPAPLALLSELEHWEEIMTAQRIAVNERLSRLVGDDPWEVSVRVGMPVGELLAAAAGADLLVLGARRHTDAGRLSLGSTALALCEQGPCSVLAIAAPVLAPTPDPIPEKQR
jgi:nucleotide-binding universal stress UspA family protein